MCCVIYLTPMPLLSRTRPDLIKSGAPPCEFHTPTINQNGWWGWLRLFTVTLSTPIWIVSLGQPHTHATKLHVMRPTRIPLKRHVWVSDDCKNFEKRFGWAENTKSVSRWQFKTGLEVFTSVLDSKNKGPVKGQRVESRHCRFERGALYSS